MLIDPTLYGFGINVLRVDLSCNCGKLCAVRRTSHIFYMAYVKRNCVVVVVSHDDAGANLAFRFGSTLKIWLDSSLDPCMGSYEVFRLRFGILEDLHIEYAIHVVFN